MSDKEIFESLGIPDFSYTKYSDIRNLFAGVLRAGGTGAGIASIFTGPITAGVSAGLFGAAELVEPNTFSDYINFNFKNTRPQENQEDAKKYRKTGVTSAGIFAPYVYKGKVAENIPQEFFQDLQVALGLIGEPSETERLFAEDTALKESL